MGSNSEFERGKDAIYKNKDRIAMGYEASEHRSDFDEGWDLGRQASDPNNPINARQVVGQIRSTYPQRPAGGRTAFHEGFASGASRTQEPD